MSSTAQHRSTTHALDGHFKARPPTFVRGEGIYLFDDTGRRYMDAVGGVGVANIGHNVPEIVSALARQARTLAFTYSGNGDNVPRQELADILNTCAPRGMGETRTFFCSGGAEANEAAVKLAYQYHWEKGHPTKRRVISRWQSYHGNTIGTLGLSGRTAWRRLYDTMAMECLHIPPPYCLRCPWGLTRPTCNTKCAEELRRTICQQGAENVAAFIAEPIIGTSMSAVTPPPEYYPKIREICDEYDVLFIADEVMSGAGRTGTMWAIEQWNVTPDMITAAKGIGGGYTALGATLVSEKIWSAFAGGSQTLMHSCTYGGNPLSCATGVAVARYIEENGLVEKASVEGDRLMQALRDSLSDLPWIADIRGRGLFIGVEIVRDNLSNAPFDQAVCATQRIAAAALADGLLILGGAPGLIDGVAGDHFELLPPYTISKDDIEWLVPTLRASVIKALEPLSLPADSGGTHTPAVAINCTDSLTDVPSRRRPADECSNPV